ncbi:MAG: VCBS repeat-containing protein, partial [bacterium]
HVHVDPSSGEENPLTSSPALGDIDNDGNLDIAVGGASGHLYVLNGRGESLPGFSDGPGEPYRAIGPSESRLGSPILANLDGDPRPEVIVGDNMGNVYAVHHDGSIMGGFPYRMSGGLIGHGLAAWDIDRDGYQNLVIQSSKSTSLVVLDFPGSPFHAEIPSENPWPQFRRDARNTGAMSGGEIVTPVLSLTVEAQTTGPLEVDLRWRCEYAVSSFSLLRFLAPQSASGSVTPPGPVTDWEPVGAWAIDELRESPGCFHVKDQPSEAGKWLYRVEAKDAAGAILLRGETSVNVGGLPRTFRLLPPQPNPFSGDVRIVCDLPSPGLYEVQVVTVDGRLMRRLFRGPAGPGRLELLWCGDAEDGSIAPQGVYFVRASVDGEKRRVQKLTLLHQRRR